MDRHRDIFISSLHVGGGVGTAIAVGMIPEFTHFQKFEVIVIIWLAFSAVADTVIAISLVWHLVSICILLAMTDLTAFQRKHKTGFSQTDDVVNKIIRSTYLFSCSFSSADADGAALIATVQTGLITALCAIIDLVLFLATVRLRRARMNNGSHCS